MLVVEYGGVVRRRFFGQVSRFAVVGALAAVVDLGIYHLALSFGLWVHAARALGFVVATVLAYIFNRRWSFYVSHTRRRALAFALLYVVTFFVVLLLNALALAVLPTAWWATTAAWAGSQVCGSMCNFIMLRWVIFRRAKVRSSQTMFSNRT